MNAGGERGVGESVSLSPAASTVLVLRAGAVGDFILTLPALAALRAKYRSHHLLLAARADVLPLVHGTLADDTLAFDSALLTPLFESHAPAAADAGNASHRSDASDTDYSSDIGTSERGSLAALRRVLAPLDLAVVWLPDPSARVVAANLRRLDAARLLSASPLPERIHAADHLVDSLAPLGIIQNDRVPHLPLGEQARSLADDFWRAHGLAGSRVVALHPGSGGARKRWELARFMALADRAAQCGDIRVLLLRGPAEADEPWHVPPGTITLDSPFLPLLASILTRCALYVGSDSGITHLAAALDVPTIALFGPTDPAVWGPRGAQTRILRSASGEMADLPVEVVWNAIIARL